MSSALLTAFAFGFYLTAAICCGAATFLNAPAAPAVSGNAAGLRRHFVMRLARPLMVTGIALQMAAIGVWCVTMHRSPFASPFGTLSTAAWAIAIAFAVLDVRARVPAVGAVALTLCSLVLFAAILNAQSPVADSPILRGRVVSLHVLAILASFGLLAFAFGCAALYLLQNHLLKQKAVSPLFRRLPPLESLDRAAYHAVAYALPLLTLGLLLGFVRIFGGNLTQPPVMWLTDPHTLISLAVWLLYVGYLTVRLALGWRGVRLQYVLLGGLLVTCALYVLPTSTHHFR